MKNFIYSKTTAKDLQSFYLISNGVEYYLFSQKFHKGVKNYFYNKVFLSEALDLSKSNRDKALIKTKTKLPMHIKYVEHEYGITVLDQTSRKKEKCKSNFRNRISNADRFFDLECA